MWVALVALGSVLLLQAIRLISPLLFARFEDLGYVPAAIVAGVVIAVGPLVAPALSRALGRRRAIVVAMSLAAAARLAVQVVDDVAPWLAAVLAIFAFQAFVVVASEGPTRDPRPFVQGVLLGAAFDVAIEAPFRTWDPVWQTGTWGVLVAAGIAAAAVAVALALPTAGERHASPVGLLALGPFLFLQAVFLQNPAFVASRSGIGLAGSAAAILLIDAAVIVVLGLSSGSSRTALRATAVLGGIGLAVASGPIAFAAIAPATLGSAASLALAMRSRWAPTAARTAVAGALGALVFAGLLIAYQKDRPLPIPATALPAIAATVLAVLPAIRPADPFPRGRIERGAALAVLAALAVPAAVWLSGSVHVRPTSGVDRLRLMSYNVHFAVTDDGQVDPESIARDIESHRPSVVVLQEAGRGWPIDGMTDVVEWLAWRLDMRYLSAAQLDDRFRATILYRPELRLASAVHGSLPVEHGPPRSYVRATFDDVAGGPVQVVATHLSGAEEVRSTRFRQVRALVRAAGDPRNTVIVGDLNAALSSPEVTVLEGAGYTSVQFLTGEREATFPEEGAIVDHVLVGKGLTATDIEVPEVAASDHLPVIVTIRRQ